MYKNKQKQDNFKWWYAAMVKNKHNKCSKCTRVFISSSQKGMLNNFNIETKWIQYYKESNIIVIDFFLTVYKYYTHNLRLNDL